MARLLNPGAEINGLIVEEHLYTGRDALSYRARSGQKTLFLKQYKSPSVMSPWYAGYQNHQRELSARLREHAGPWVAPLDSFEAMPNAPALFQVFPFFEPCLDLERRLAQPPQNDDPQKRLMLAIRLTSAVTALHKSGIIHADLKPANILLPRDDASREVSRLLLVDFDFSLLCGIRPPWHGHQGCLGSPLYYSPEHIRGETPRPESDIYACGLILLELLDGAHPYRFFDGTEYAKAMLGFTARIPALSAFANREADIRPLQKALHECLSPAPERRPRLDELSEMLEALWNAQRQKPQPARSAATAPPAGPCLTLAGEEQGVLHVRIQSAIGRPLLERFGPDARYAGRRQFTLRPTPEGWLIEPDPSAPNDTLINNERLHAPRILHEGDIIGIGRQSKGLFFLPMHVHLQSA